MIRTFSAIAFVVLCTASPALAQNNCPLELMRPGPVGAAGAGHDESSYIYRAFTGVTWNMRAAVRCGDWREYKFALRNAPAGMSVVPGPCTTQPCDAGTITWTNPTATAADVQLVVSDADETDSATWTIKVSACAPGPGGCCVIDADKGSDLKGSGTPASPWQTLAKAHGACGARSVMFMRGAPAVTNSYQLDGLPARKRHYSDSIDYRESSHPVIWIGWPGELPTIDLGYPRTMRAALELTGRNIWLDNFRTINPYTITFSLIRANQYGAVARRLVMRGAGPGINGANSAFLMFQRSDGPTFAEHIANNDFGEMNYANGNSCVKMYSMQNPIIEDNVASKIRSRVSEHEGCFAIKFGIVQFTVRHNQCSDFPAEIPCFSGNMHAGQGLVVSGEMHHNNVILPDGAAYDFNQDGMAGLIRHWNNTWQGQVTARNVDSSDGPFIFERDVFLNAGGTGRPCPSRLSCDHVTDGSRIVVKDVLTGQPDGKRASRTTGQLLEPHLAKDGPQSPVPKGHMLRGGTTRKATPPHD